MFIFCTNFSSNTFSTNLEVIAPRVYVRNIVLTVLSKDFVTCCKIFSWSESSAEPCLRWADYIAAVRGDVCWKFSRYLQTRSDRPQNMSGPLSCDLLFATTRARSAKGRPKDATVRPDSYIAFLFSKIHCSTETQKGRRRVVRSQTCLSW